MALNTIWHNPRCAKSKTTLKLLNDRSIHVKVFYYLNEIINYEDLISIVKKISIPTIELVRTNEKIFRALGLSRSSKDEVLIQAMLQNKQGGFREENGRIINHKVYWLSNQCSYGLFNQILILLQSK